MAVSREALDQALVEAALAAGVHFLPHTEAMFVATEKTTPPAPYRLLTLRQAAQHAQLAAAVVLAADGLTGRLLHSEPGMSIRVTDDARMGAGAVLPAAPPDFEAGVIYMTSGRGGYVGVVQLEDGRLDVAAALDREAVRHSGGPGPLAAAILRDGGLSPPLGLTDAAWRGTPPLTRRPVRPFAHRLLAVGDAAGYIEPFTGEGIGWALAGGAAVAPLAVAAAENWSEALGQAWEQRYRRIIARRQLACRWLSRLLRHPPGCAAAVLALRLAPQLAWPVVRRINRPFER